MDSLAALDRADRLHDRTQGFLRPDRARPGQRGGSARPLQTVEPLVPVQIGPWPASTRLVFIAGTLAGIPLVAAGVLVIGSLVRGRWKSLAWFAGSSLVASVILAGVWLWSDRRSMPAIERYDRSSAYLAGLLGCYAVAVLVVLGGSVRGIIGAIWRRRTRPVGPVDAGRGAPTM
jgi:hypothetical protein